MDRYADPVRTVRDLIIDLVEGLLKQEELEKLQARFGALRLVCGPGDTLAKVAQRYRVSPADLKGLRALAEETRLKKRLVVCMEPRERITDDGIAIVPAARFLEELWSGGVITDL